MAQPVWITPAGNLGTIAEGVFFRQAITAEDPDGGTVTYQLISGSLPTGIQVKPNGVIEGTPDTTAYVQGVPVPVAQDVTSRFAVRATSGSRINDRTFEVTITGQDVPEFVTPAGSIGTFYDGDPVNFTFEFTDDDPGDTITVSIESGELPPGVELSSSGVLSGFIIPATPLPPGTVVGFDGSAFDLYTFDFETDSIDRNYQFTLKISDGKDRNIRTFEMFVVSRDTLTADTTEITADDDEITADSMPFRIPFITNYPTGGNIGTYRHANFFAYQITAIDLDGDPIEFEIAFGDSIDIPPGLTFDRLTGWLTGYLPNQGATEITYNFAISVAKLGDTAIQSPEYSYSITIIGDITSSVTWITPQDLGTIENGAVSLLRIEATTETGKPLFYRLKAGDYPEIPGVYNKLPQGLSLLESGDISGRVSFNGFALDGGTTTFDQELSTRLDIDPTTFDSSFTFTVEVYSNDGLISVFRTFTVKVLREYNSPYESLYIQAMPPQEDRDLINSLVQNRDIFPPSSIFRPDDPYFGVATRVIYTHAYGLESATLDEYVLALQLNHFRKRLILGEIKTAQALDSAGNVLYEVVYSDVVDTGVNRLGQSPGQTVPTAFPILSEDGSTEITEVYPNSLINMRTQVIDTVGQDGSVLPLWMTSKQANGRVLGFTRAWVIAYTNPGQSARVAYNVRTQFGETLNRVDWTVDRYILDRELTKNWIPNEDSTDGGNWITPEQTTFDFIQSIHPTASGNPTTFDGDSIKFVSPVDMYSYTDEYNKYLVFPKFNILG